LRGLKRGCLIAIGVLAFVILFWGVIPFAILPNSLGWGVAMPVISLPGEALIGTKESPVLTNTFVGTLLADVIVLLIAFSAVRDLKEVPGRLQNIFEFMVEALYSLCQTVAGKNARKAFPLMATIFFFIITANWLELIPGVDSIGLMHCAEPGMTGYPRQGITLDVRGPLGAARQVATEADYQACEAALHGGEHDADTNAASYQGAEEGTPLYIVTPFVRAATTDLNQTLALAIVAMVMVQVLGYRSLGIGYFIKFINLPALRNIRKKPVGALYFFAGLLELISEFIKVISFTFRLFGNIFAGQVLLFVMTFLVAWFVPVVFYGLELFVGAIQAFVFAMLFLVFSSMAMAGHGDEHH
jgi:F-type H+-transporting ATPase subunit a